MSTYGSVENLINKFEDPDEIVNLDDDAPVIY